MPNLFFFGGERDSFSQGERKRERRGERGRERDVKELPKALFIYFSIGNSYKKYSNIKCVSFLAVFRPQVENQPEID